MGLILGSNLFFFKNKFQNDNFQNNNLKKNIFFRKFRILELIEKISKNFSKNIFDPLAIKIVIQNRRHDSALSLLFPPKHIDLCPQARTALGYSVRIFELGLVDDSRGHSLCDLCFIQKLSFLRGQLPIRQTLWISRLFS